VTPISSTRGGARIESDTALARPRGEPYLLLGSHAKIPGHFRKCVRRPASAFKVTALELTELRRGFQGFLPESTTVDRRSGRKGTQCG